MYAIRSYYGNRFNEVRQTRGGNDWSIDPSDAQLRWIEEDLKNAQGKWA